MMNDVTRKAIEQLWKELEKNFVSEVAEDFIEVLLKLMAAVFLLDYDYRKNIKNFNGRYLFKSTDGGVAVSAIFENSRLKVMDGKVDDPHVTIIFRSGKALLNFIFSPSQDILQAMLNNELRTQGNLNYIYRFGFLAKKLQLMMTGQ